jgi:O-antigen/teichoic acid export membrane protein
VEDKKSYNSIFKSSTLFGGVQIIQVVIQLLRSKMVAILLGPSGIGILGLLNNTLNFVGSITNFGLGTSAINEISYSNKSKNEYMLNFTISLLNSLFWITGIVGMLICIFFSKNLSHLSFGNENYTLSFISLSIAVLLNQLTSGNVAVLQGLRNLTSLAKANVFGSILGLLLSFPFFYFLGIDGIVASIIAYSFSLFVFTKYFVNKIEYKPNRISIKDILYHGRSMLSSGFILGISGLFSMLTSYLISLFIAKNGSIEQLGLYTSGLAISTNYTGLIFTAIATDYHPRLAALPDNKSIAKVVNQQAEITLLILTPLILVFLVFGEILIKLLYSRDFVSIKPMISWMLIGALFKLFSWAMSFTFVARGKIKLFFWNELLANLYVFILGILGYYFFGLVGLGYSFVISYILYSIQIYILANKIFEFKYEKKFIRTFIIHVSLSFLVYSLVKSLSIYIGMVLGTLLILAVFYFSIKDLMRKLDIPNLLKSDTV